MLIEILIGLLIIGIAIMIPWIAFDNNIPKKDRLIITTALSLNLIILITYVVTHTELTFLYHKN